MLTVPRAEVAGVKARVRTYHLHPFSVNDLPRRPIGTSRTRFSLRSGRKASRNSVQNDGRFLNRFARGHAPTYCSVAAGTGAASTTGAGGGVSFPLVSFCFAASILSATFLLSSIASDFCHALSASAVLPSLR